MDLDAMPSSEGGGEGAVGRHSVGGSWAAPSSVGNGSGGTAGAALSRVSHRRSPQDSGNPSNAVMSASSHSVLVSALSLHSQANNPHQPLAPLPLVSAADRLSDTSAESDASPDSPVRPFPPGRNPPLRAGLHPSSAGGDSVPGPLRALLNQLSDLHSRSSQTLQTIETIRDNELHRPSSSGASVPAASGNGGQLSTRVDDVNIRDAFLRDFTLQPQQNEPPNEEDSTAAAAERYRLGNGSGMDIQATANWLEQLLPFLYLLLVVFITQHSLGIVVLFWIIMTGNSCNDAIRKQVALKEQRRAVILVTIKTILVVHTLAVVGLLGREGVYFNMLILLPGAVHSVWHVLYLVLLADMGVKLFGMSFKIAVLLLHRPSPGQDFRRQGQVLTMLEYFLLAYRAILPCGTWYRYFLSTDVSPYMASAVTGMYLSFKLSMIWDRLLQAMQSIRTVARCDAQYGQYATHEEVMECGGVCSICQENMSQPLRLSCRHIFCEDCVSEWFERERTCPLCRAIVKPPGLKSYSDGNTSTAPQLF